MTLQEAIANQEKALAEFKLMIPGACEAASQWEREVEAAELVLAAAKRDADLPEVIPLTVDTP